MSTSGSKNCFPHQIPDAGIWNAAEPDRAPPINGLYTADVDARRRLL
ncbi:hypothetical protein [Streptomyces massasporeus]